MSCWDSNNASGAAARNNTLVRILLALANHILPILDLEGVGMTRIIEFRHSSGDGTMRVAIEVNVALWGMILCGLQTAQHFY